MLKIDDPREYGFDGSAGGDFLLAPRIFDEVTKVA
jgi:hypothetical protein